MATIKLPKKVIIDSDWRDDTPESKEEYEYTGIDGEQYEK